MKSLIMILAMLASMIHATEFSGRFVGTIDSMEIDEPIRCLGKNPPEAFFQGSNPASSDKGALEISGGASGNYLNLVVRGPGIDLRGRFKGFSKKDGKISFSGIKKRNNKQDQKVDISFWCE